MVKKMVCPVCNNFVTKELVTLMFHMQEHHEENIRILLQKGRTNRKNKKRI